MVLADARRREDPTRPVGDPVVELRGVTKRYPAARDGAALSDVDLTIMRGEVFGVVGESGAGKSTLLQLLNGLTTATSGTVTVAGKDVGTLGPRGLRALRRDIGTVFQGVDLLSNRTVRANVALPLELARRARRDGARGPRTLAALRARRARERAAVEEILEFVGLTHRAHHHPAQLSGGEQQRVGLARALVARPSLLLCDEPTSSLDASTTADVLRVLAAARDDLGTTVVVVTHDLDVVKAICDRAAYLERGELKELFRVARRDYATLPSYHEQVRRELMA